MSTLLHDVLKHQQNNIQMDNLTARLNNIQITRPDGGPLSPKSPVHRTPSPTSEGEEWIPVESAMASPMSFSVRSSAAGSRSGSRAHSPTRMGAASRRLPGSLLLSPTSKASSSTKSRDLLRVLPTDISQKIFGLLTIKQLAKCARVSKKWNKSQTINYVWFQHYRKEHFHDESLPPGKWTRRESKQNWRITFLETRRKAAIEQGSYLGSAPSAYSNYRSGTASYAGSGYQTPREAREEKWKQEGEESSLGKNEMREMYKGLNGRKARSKSKYQTNTSSRDKGGWTNPIDEYEG